MNLNKAKKPIIDIIYNLIASSLPVFLLQLLIQPFINRVVGNTVYGDMLTVISCIDICIGMFGSPFNNTRLLEDRNYKSPGDFNILIAISLGISVSLQLVLSAIYHFNIDFISIIILCIFNICSILVSYHSVEFRLKLSFKNIMFAKICQGFGYCLGAGVFYLTKRWEFVFFFGGVFELTYVMCHTSLWKERYCFTNNFRPTFKRLIILIATTCLTLIITYADRLIIYPAFGSEQVSIYYAATVIGKAVLIITNPIGGVLLSYTAKMDTIKKNVYIMLVGAVTLLAVVGYVIASLMSGPIIRFLYPSCYPQALSYTPITNATVMIGLFYSFCWPVVFRFGAKGSPLVLIGVRIISYLSIAILGMKTWGVFSICYGNLISSILQAVVVIIMGLKVCEKKPDVSVA